MNTKIIIAAALAVVTLVSCNDFLTREPYDSEDSDKFFSNEEELKVYANGLYVAFIPDAGSLSYDNTTTDNIAVSSTPTFLQASFAAYHQGGWRYSSWKDLFRCNYFLEHIDKASKACSADTLNHYRAIARYWRAQFYYGQVRTYGDVPWYSHTIAAEDSAQLYKGRDSREMVMDSVLNDINYACTYLRSSKSEPINRNVALAFKSRLCLFEGTFRKYHHVNPSTGEPWTDNGAPTRFLRECVKASEELMNGGGYSLSTGDSASYHSLFSQEIPNPQEVILAREYSRQLSITNDVTQEFNLAANKMGASQEFVNMYLMRDGSRFTDRPGYKNYSYKQNFQNRDWRLGETFIKPGDKIKHNGVDIDCLVNWEIGVTGYQVMKFNIEDKAAWNTGKGYNAIPIFRYAEVLLNEAEAKAELGEMNESVWNKTVKPLRERAGVNGKAPTSADPYLVSYYRNQTNDPWMLEIRRERSIELFMEAGNLRYWDLIRWHLGELFMNKWTCVNGASSHVNLKSKYYSKSGNTVWVNNNASFDERKYVRPIPRSALVMNPNLKQNIGWKEN